MKTGLIVLGVIILIVVGGIGWAIGINNQLVGQEQLVNEKWAQVQNVYQRRADLIPNLVNTVSGAANFEKSTLAEIVEARASAGRVTLPAGGAPTDPAKFVEFEKAQARLGWRPGEGPRALGEQWNRKPTSAEAIEDLRFSHVSRMVELVFGKCVVMRGSRPLIK